jgi:hypothetical protein
MLHGQKMSRLPKGQAALDEGGNRVAARALRKPPNLGARAAWLPRTPSLFH